MKTRLSRLADDWKVTVSREVIKPTAVIAYGTRGDEQVVMKVGKVGSDEWRAGDILRAWGGKGAVKCLALADGACLMERITPATPLTTFCESGKDGAACEVIARLIETIPRVQLPGFPTAEDLGRGFDRYLKSQNKRLDPSLVMTARDMYLELCATQTNPHLRHGDLQHYNVLKDDRRGWLVIDPKGVVAEVEFELGAMLRNPHNQPKLLTKEAAVARVNRMAPRLGIWADRVLKWAFSQAVLSAIWSAEDWEIITPDLPSLRLAAALRP